MKSDTAHDPRSTLTDADAVKFAARGRSAVARPADGREGLALTLGVGGAAVLGVVVFLSMSKARQAEAAAPTTTVGTSATAVKVVATESSTAPVIRVQPASNPGAAKVAADSATRDAAVFDARASVLVLDMGAAPGAPAAVGAAGPGGPPPANPANLLGEEAFAARIGAEAPATARTVKMAAPALTVPQGALIPAVLETALNSDLPGYARAMVSRDVRGFDGSRVLIPRGSRLIGQYKSGIAAGQTRAYVVWSRVLLPDGASVQLGSPLVDGLGETGAAGRVDKHFVERFGSASLLSVLGGVIGALSDSSSVVVTTSAQAQSIAAIALQNDGRIPPTIRVRQGEPIQVFVARDLVFDL